MHIIERQRPVFYMVEVERDVFVEGRVVSGFDLPEAGGAGSNVEALEVASLIFLDFVSERRTKSRVARRMDFRMPTNSPAKEARGWSRVAWCGQRE
jgi:hypothetical protein